MALETHLAAIRAALDKHVLADKALAETLAAELATAIPTGWMLVWRQYTPYFNDGEACEFSVQDPFAHPAGSNGQEELCSYHLDRLRNAALREEPGAPTVEQVTQLRGLLKLWNAASSQRDRMRAAFGDHVEITVHADGSFNIDGDTDHG